MYEQCGAERPRCASCIQRSIVCRYTTTPTETRAQALKRKYSDLKSRHTALKDLFQLLQSTPEEDSLALLRKVRAGEDPESIIKFAMDDNLLLQLALVPETRFRYQFPYIKSMPLSLQTPDNPYIVSTIYEWTVGTSATSQPSSETESMQRNENEHPSRYLKPFHAAVLVDPVLSSVKPSTWTSVSADNELMRSLLGEYFLREHMWFTYINKNLFLEDMASGSERFCSSLLVNAVLAFACHCNRRMSARAEYWNPFTLGYKFLAEAKRLWEREQQESKITSIQAALFLNGISNLDGADAIGWQYTSRAVNMAHELELFAVTPKTVSVKMRIAREFTAWTLFCWQGIVSYVMFRSPLVHAPPKASLPDPLSFPEWYGDFWIKYPLDQTPSPAHHGHDFKARAELISIINEIALEYFGDDQLQRLRSMESILKYYTKLKAWYDALPEPLTAKQIVLPSHLKLHMKYHNLMINLFQPLIDDNQSLSDYAAFAEVVHQHPKEAIWSATIRLETLLRIYYLRHGFDAMDAYILHFLNTLGFISMNELKAGKQPSMAEDRRCLLLLCALGLREQGQFYYLVRTIYHLFRSSMSSEDVNLLKLYAQDYSPEKDKLYIPQDLISEYSLNIIDISRDPQTRRVTHLVKETKNLSLAPTNEE
ncbi:putative zinc finger protein [Trichoderma chlorosporum]